MHFSPEKHETRREKCSNTKLIYGVNLRIQPEYGKTQTLKNLVLYTFHRVRILEIKKWIHHSCQLIIRLDGLGYKLG